jgi:phenylalanyl-tRNA synthetase beta chain
MRVPLEWLREYVAITDSAEEVATRLTMGGLEVEGIEESPLGPVLDVYVTPNRGDCLSMLGVAREIAALYGVALAEHTPPKSADGGPVSDLVKIQIQDPDLCPRYAGRVIRGISIGPSPDWMQARLEAAGMRPINNVVDVTNYVMLELGQPLHAFDLHLLAERTIVVRRAQPGETLETLDGEPRTLTGSMLVIADASKPVALAGVMGGANSEVGDTTTDILLESAHFHPLTVRRTSRALNLRTEASYRFERTVDPNGVRRAVDRACELLAAVGQTGVVEGAVDVYPEPILPRTIQLRPERAAALLGIPEIDAAIATDCLRRLQLTVETEGDSLLVTVPTGRTDLAIEEDLIEEVGRIYGYENIPETLPKGTTTRGGDSPEGVLLTSVRSALVEAGLQEVVTHSLSAPSFFDSPADATRRVGVRNVLSAEVSGLRASLIPTLLDVAQHNASRGQQALTLFEVGRIWEQTGEGAVESISLAGLLVGTLRRAGWRKDDAVTDADFGTVRGVVERLAERLQIDDLTIEPLTDNSEGPRLHPGRAGRILLGGKLAGYLGELHPEAAAHLSFRARIYVFEIAMDAIAAAVPQDTRRYVPVSRFPAVVRDLAPRLPESVPYAAIEAAIRSAEPGDLQEYRLIDLYRGVPLREDQKSLTLSLTFRSPIRTLVDSEVDEALQRIRKSMQEECGAEFPS